MKKLSFNIALGGIVSALCILLMFLVGVFPFFVYAFPMLCSLLICVVFYESGVKTALITYASICVLSLLLSADKESAIIFTALFGYYPIAKIYIDKISYKFLRLLLKLAIFNFTMLLSYHILIKIFGVVDLSEIAGEATDLSVLALLIIGNITFVFYDFAIKRLSDRYLAYWRKHLFKGSKR